MARYWVECKDTALCDLVWMLGRFPLPLVVNEQPAERDRRLVAYRFALDAAYNRHCLGRWKGQHVRYALEQVMREFGVHFPMWLF